MVVSNKMNDDNHAIFLTYVEPFISEMKAIVGSCTWSKV